METNNLPTVKQELQFARPRKSNSEITIKNIALPQKDSCDEKLAWICASLGFFENIDKGKTAAIIFKELYLAGMRGQVVTSTTLAEKIGMSRGSVINHLKNLQKAGLVEKGGKYYFTRHKTMQGILAEVEDDLMHIFLRMKRIGKEVDKEVDTVIRMK